MVAVAIALGAIMAAGVAAAWWQGEQARQQSAAALKQGEKALDVQTDAERQQLMIALAGLVLTVIGLLVMLFLNRRSLGG